MERSNDFVDWLMAYGLLVLRAQDDANMAGFHAAVRQMLCAHPISDDLVALMDGFIDIAHKRMPSSDSSTAFHWRTLYIDASILKALARASMPDLHEDLVRECISTLDDAIIIAGAASDDGRRDYVVHDVIRQLQSIIVPWRSPSNAVLIATPTPRSPRPLPTSRNSIPALATLPSIITAEQRWSRAPFIIHGYADNWPAMHPPHQWASLSYLFSVAGPGRMVPVEVGDDYRSDDWSQRLITWEEFLSSLDPSTVSAHSHRPTLYLAQHNLMMQFPQLRQDIILPDLVYACLRSPDFPPYEPPSDVVLNAWLGPKGTISPAHTDPFFNCYVQVVGRKTIWLAPPRVAPAMYPSPPSQPGTDRSNNPAANTTSPSLSNTSRVDVFPTTAHEMEASRSAFPLFWDTVFDEAFSVTLDPGDLLFFPPGWWHAMRSEDVSFSVSMWF